MWQVNDILVFLIASGVHGFWVNHIICSDESRSTRHLVCATWPGGCSPPHPTMRRSFFFFSLHLHFLIPFLWEKYFGVCVFLWNNEQAYNGMIIGEHSRDSDLEVNVKHARKGALTFLLLRVSFLATGESCEVKGANKCTCSEQGWKRPPLSSQTGDATLIQESWKGWSHAWCNVVILACGLMTWRCA